jgi:hypothetical protein
VVSQAQVAKQGIMYHLLVKRGSGIQTKNQRGYVDVVEQSLQQGGAFHVH